MRTKGKISSWNGEKGFGFITPLTGGKRVFVHIRAFGNRNRRPEIDQVVTYDLSTDNQGRPCAVMATLTGDRLPQDMQKTYGSLPIIIAAVFLVIVGVAVLASRIPSVILGIYMVISLMTFVAYVLDKSAAEKGGWRTRESTLHLLSLGAVAGWFAGTLMHGGGFGLLGHIVVGVIGAVSGGFVFGLPGISAGGLIGSIVTTTAGCALLLFIVGITKKA